jgi:hypothetical protein
MGISLCTLVDEMWSSPKVSLLLTSQNTIHSLYVSTGYDNLGVHTFNTKKALHKFCKTCGSSILADFDRVNHGDTEDPARDILAVNVSLLLASNFSACLLENKVLE